MSEPKFKKGDIVWLSWANRWFSVVDSNRVGVSKRRWEYRLESIQEPEQIANGVHEKYLMEKP